MQHSNGRPHGSGSSLSRLACLESLIGLHRHEMPYLDSTTLSLPK